MSSFVHYESVSVPYAEIASVCREVDSKLTTLQGQKHTDHVRGQVRPSIEAGALIPDKVRSAQSKSEFRYEQAYAQRPAPNLQ